MFDTAPEGGGGTPAPAPEGGDPAPAEREGNSPATPDPSDTSLIGEGGEPAADPAEGEEGSEGEGESTPSAEPVTEADIQLPEGFEVPEGGLQPFVDLINNTELSDAERANEFMRLHTEAVQTSIEELNRQTAELWSNQVNEWRDAARALPEIGGDNLDQTLADIKSGLNKLGATEATYEALNLTGAGNHPELIKILHAATAHLKEGTNPSAEARPGGAKPRTQAERLYPS